MAPVLGDFVADGEWSLADAVRVATMIGAGQRLRVYRLGASEIDEPFTR